MARPRTMSDPITFRVPLNLLSHLEARAARKKQTVPEYVQDAMIRTLKSDAKSTGEALPAPRRKK